VLLAEDAKKRQGERTDLKPEVDKGNMEANSPQSSSPRPRDAPLLP